MRMVETHDSVGSLLRAHAESRPDAVAIVDAVGDVTYSQLDGASDRCAAALRDAGVAAGDRVAVLDYNGRATIELMFACAKTGAILVPLNYRLSGRELGDIVAATTPGVLVVNKEFAAVVEDVRRSLGDRSPRIVWVAGGRGTDSYVDWRDRAQPLVEGDRGFNETFLLTYTSGSTGGPKGVMIGHAAFGQALEEAAKSWRIGADSTVMVALPMCHIGGITWFMSGFARGARIVLLERGDPAAIMAGIEAHRVTHINIVAALLQAMLVEHRTNPRDVSSLAVLTCGGSPVPGAHLRNAIEDFGCTVIAFYGLSEAGGGVSHHVLHERYLQDDADPRLLSAGRPMPGVDIRIRDTASSDLRPPGAVGEVVVRTPGVMVGYWGLSEQTAEVFDPAGWLSTGDIGRLDEDGFLYILDRLKDLIISGGENVYAGEVEDVLAEHPAIAEVAVVGRPDPKWGESPVAYAVARAGADPDPADIIAWARDRLAHFKCPKSVIVVTSLPRTTTGKLDKRTIRSWAVD
jgi:acyl-CoA synthetase (AMP-forming)/AMP-acid ligase II